MGAPIREVERLSPRAVPAQSQIDGVKPDHRFGAFVSYHRESAGHIAEALQVGLHGLFRSPFRREPFVRVFRDYTDMGTGGRSLGQKIEDALRDSSYLIVVLSSGAAESPWVAREIEFWLRECDPRGERIIPVIAHDSSTRLTDYDWGGPAVPQMLRPHFRRRTPLAADLRWAGASLATADSMTVADARFREGVIGIAATIKGTTPTAMAGEIRSMQRIAQRLWGALAVSVVGLLVSATVAVILAVQAGEAGQRTVDAIAAAAEAESAAQASEARVVAAESQLKSAEAAVAAAEVSLAEAQEAQALAVALVQAAETANEQAEADRVAAEVSSAEAIEAEQAAIEARDRAVAAVAAAEVERSVAEQAQAAAETNQRQAELGEADARAEQVAAEVSSAEAIEAEQAALEARDRAVAAERTAEVERSVAEQAQAAAETNQRQAELGEADARVEQVAAEAAQVRAEAAARSADASLRVAETAQVEAEQALVAAEATQRQAEDAARLANDDLQMTQSSLTAAEETIEAAQEVAEQAMEASAAAAEEARAARVASDAAAVEAETARAERAAARAQAVTAETQLEAAEVVALDAAQHATRISLASDAEQLVSSNPALALVLAAESVAMGGESDGVAHHALAVTRAGFASSGLQPVGEPFSLGRDDLVFSPDGSRLAGVVDASTVQIFDASSFEPLGAPLSVQSEPYGIAFSPDGMQLVTGGSDGMLTVWDLATRAAIRTTQLDCDQPPAGLAFSPDLTRVAAHCGLEASPYLWDGVTGERLASVTGNPYTVVFSPDGSLFVTVGDQGDQLVDAQTLEPVIADLGDLLEARFSPDGSILATASFDDSLQLWDTAAGSPIDEPLVGHTDWVTSLAFRSDGKVLASGARDGTLRLWDVEARRAIGGPLLNTTLLIASLAFRPGTDVLLSVAERPFSDEDTELRLWATGPLQPLSRSLIGHTTSAWAIGFSPDGTMLASASFEGTVRLWDVESGRPIGQPLVGHTSSVKDVEFSRDGHLLASASSDGTARLWDVRSGEPIAVWHGHEGSVLDVAFSPDGRILAAASERDGQTDTVLVWDIEAGAPLPVEFSLERVYRLVFSPAGDELFVFNSTEGWVWDWETGAVVRSLTHEPPAGAWTCCSRVGPDGPGTAYWDLSAGKVYLQDLITGEDLSAPLAMRSSTLSVVAFSPGLPFAAIADARGSIRLFDVATGEHRGLPLQGHSDGLIDAAFSPDGTWLATASDDGTLRLWDAVWDWRRACELAVPYVSASQLAPYLDGASTGGVCELQ